MEERRGREATRQGKYAWAMNEALLQVLAGKAKRAGGGRGPVHISSTKRAKCKQQNATNKNVKMFVLQTAKMPNEREVSHVFVFRERFGREPTCQSHRKSIYMVGRRYL